MPEQLPSKTDLETLLPSRSQASVGSLLADMFDEDADEEATLSGSHAGLEEEATCMRPPMFDHGAIDLTGGTDAQFVGLASQLEPSFLGDRRDLESVRDLDSLLDKSFAFEPTPFASQAFSSQAMVSGTLDTSAKRLPSIPPIRTPQFSPANGAPLLVAPPLPHQDALEPGGYIGKYQLVERLGQGAFGLVFIAYDTELDREVAIKILNPTHLTNADVLHRFLQEARTTARIAHPGIVTILDFGQVVTGSGDTTAFIAMELLQGQSLTERLARSGRLDPIDAIEIVRQCASALDAAHRAEVLHRDLKPDNIMLVADPAVPSGERVKVFDFGLAKLGRVGQTQVESIFGTPRYMSPEQWRSAAQIDPRSDIYALGCILFELVTGQTPFIGKLKELFELHSRTLAPRASSLNSAVPPALDDLVAAMLAKDPAQRPQSMEALSATLQMIGAMLAAGMSNPSLHARGSAPDLSLQQLAGYMHAPPPPPPAQIPDGTHNRAPTYHEPIADTAVLARSAWKPPAIAFSLAAFVAALVHWL